MNYLWIAYLWILCTFVLKPKVSARSYRNFFGDSENVPDSSSCNENLLELVQQLLSEVPRKHVPLDETKKPLTICWIHTITTVQNNYGELINQISEYSLTFEAPIINFQDFSQEQDVYNSNRQSGFVTPGRVVYSNTFEISQEKYVKCMKNPTCSEEESDMILLGDGTAPYASQSDACNDEFSETSSSEILSGSSSEFTSAENDVFPLMLFYDSKLICLNLVKKILFGVCPENLNFVPVIEKYLFPDDIQIISVESIPQQFSENKMVIKGNRGCYMLTIHSRFECPDIIRNMEQGVTSEILPTLAPIITVPDVINTKCFPMKKITLTDKVLDENIPTISKIEYIGVHSKVIFVKCPASSNLQPVIDEKLFPDLVTFIHSSVEPDLSDKNNLLVKGKNHCFVLKTIKNEECTNDINPFVVMEIGKTELITVTPKYKKNLEKLLETSDKMEEITVNTITPTVNSILEFEKQFDSTPETTLKPIIQTGAIPLAGIIQSEHHKEFGKQTTSISEIELSDYSQESTTSNFAESKLKETAGSKVATSTTKIIKLVKNVPDLETNLPSYILWATTPKYETKLPHYTQWTSSSKLSKDLLDFGTKSTLTESTKNKTSQTAETKSLDSTESDNVSEQELLYYTKWTPSIKSDEYEPKQNLEHISESQLTENIPVSEKYLPDNIKRTYKTIPVESKPSKIKDLSEEELPDNNKWVTATQFGKTKLLPYPTKTNKLKLSLPTEDVSQSKEILSEYQLQNEIEQPTESILLPDFMKLTTKAKSEGTELFVYPEKKSELLFSMATEKVSVSDKEIPVRDQWKRPLEQSESFHKREKTTPLELSPSTELNLDLEIDESDYNKFATTPKYEENELLANSVKITNTKLPISIKKWPASEKETEKIDKLFVSERDLQDQNQWITTPLYNMFKLSHKPEQTTQSILLQPTHTIRQSEAEFSDYNKLPITPKPDENKVMTHPKKITELELLMFTETIPTSKKHISDYSQLHVKDYKLSHKLDETTDSVTLQSTLRLATPTEELSVSEKKSSENIQQKIPAIISDFDFLQKMESTIEPELSQSTKIISDKKEKLGNNNTLFSTPKFEENSLVTQSVNVIETKLPSKKITLSKQDKRATTQKSEKLLTHTEKNAETAFFTSTKIPASSTKFIQPNTKLPLLSQRTSTVKNEKLLTHPEKTTETEFFESTMTPELANEFRPSEQITTIKTETLLTHPTKTIETKYHVSAEKTTFSSKFAPSHGAEETTTLKTEKLLTQLAETTESEFRIPIKEPKLYNDVAPSYVAKQATTLKNEKLLTQPAETTKIEIHLSTDKTTMANQLAPSHGAEEITTVKTEKFLTYPAKTNKTEFGKPIKELKVYKEIAPSHVPEHVITLKNKKLSTQPVKITEVEFYISTDKTTMPNEFASSYEIEEITTLKTEKVLTHPTKTTQIEFNVPTESSTLSIEVGPLHIPKKVTALKIEKLFTHSPNAIETQFPASTKKPTLPFEFASLQPTEQVTTLKSEKLLTPKRSEKELLTHSAEEEISNPEKEPSKPNIRGTTLTYPAKTTELKLDATPKVSENKTLTLVAGTAEITTTSEEPNYFPIKIALVKTNNEGTQPTIENITCKDVDKNVEIVECPVTLTNDKFALFEEKRIPKFAKFLHSDALPDLNNPNNILVKSETICCIFKLIGSISCKPLNNPLVVFLITKENGQPITDISSIPTTISTSIPLEITKYEKSVTTEIPSTFSELMGSQDVITNSQLFTISEAPTTVPHITLDYLSHESTPIPNSVNCDEESEELLSEFPVKIVQLQKGKQEENCYVADKHIMRLTPDVKISPMAFVNENSIPSDGSVHITSQPFYLQKKQTIFAHGENNVYGFKINNKIKCVNQTKITTIVILDDDTMVSIKPHMESTTLLNEMSTTQVEGLTTEPIVSSTLENLEKRILHRAPNDTNICYVVEENMNLTTVPCPKDTSHLFQIQHPDIVQIICTERLKKQLRSLSAFDILKTFQVIQMP